MALPTLTIIGNTTDAAELRFTQSGKAVASLTVVANKRKKNDRGEWEDAGRSPFVRVSLWDSDAEALAEAVTEKGTKVIVTGQLGAREYEDRDGNKRESIELEYATVGVVPRAQRGSYQPAASAPANDPWAPVPTDSQPPF